MARDANFVNAATEIQKTWRGFLGKKRMEHKKRLDEAAQEAVLCVDPQHLFVTDIKQLARRIQVSYSTRLHKHHFPRNWILHLY